MFSPQENVSPFDVNMACDAGYDAIIPYTNVTLPDIKSLVQDAIFSRSLSNAKKTGIFICGKDVSLALDMMDSAKQSMVPPFEVSVFPDPAGSFTTAAAMVACTEKTLMEKLNGYIQIHPDNYEDIDTDLWIKYVTDEGKLKGGGLLVCNRAPLYFVLKSPYTKRSWCVNLEKNSIFMLPTSVSNNAFVILYL